ncbi:MAG: type II CAAX endopeptidase family protein [Victivallaceae bacterium]
MLEFTDKKFDVNNPVLNAGFATAVPLLIIFYLLLPAVVNATAVSASLRQLNMGLLVIAPSLIILMALLVVIYFAGTKGQLFVKLELVDWNAKYLAVALTGAFGMLFLAGAVTYGFGNLLKILNIHFESPIFLKLVLECDNKTLVALGVAAIVLAPVTEEIIFRRLIFGFVAARTGVIMAMTLTSLAFAAIHFSIVQLPGLFLLGMAFQIFYLRFNSLYPAILLHAFNNTIAFAGILLIRILHLPVA